MLDQDHVKKGRTGAGIIDTIGDVIRTVAPLAPLLLAAGKKTRSKTGGRRNRLGGYWRRSVAVTLRSIKRAAPANGTGTEERNDST